MGLHLILKREPSAVKFQCQAVAVSPNEQINGILSEVSLLELAGSALLAVAVSLISPLFTQTCSTFSFTDGQTQHVRDVELL